MSRFKRISLLLIGPVILAGACLAVYLLLDIPFGPTFEAALYLAAAGLILTTSLPGVWLLMADRRLLKTFGTLLLLASLFVFVFAATVTVDYTLLPWISAKRNITVEQWREDLAYLAREMPLAHPDLFENLSEEDFKEAVSDLDRRMGELDAAQAKAEIARIAAMPNDAHTFPNIFSFSLDLHIYPLQLFFFGDRLMVVDAGREHQEMTGCELVEICGVPVEEALQAVAPYLSAENEIGARERNLAAITVSELLYASGVAEGPDRAAFALTDRVGQRFTITMRPYNYIPVGYWAYGRTIDNTFCPAEKAPRVDNYRFEHREGTGTIYVQFNQCFEDEDLSMTEFASQLGALVESTDFERFVVDIRNNDGGNGGMVHPLAELIAGNDNINRDGRLFVIIGRRTFSAAVMFAALLGNTTKAIFVGEPSAQGPVFFSSPNPLVLPNSGMEIFVSSSLTLGSFEWDRRDRISPDIPVDYTWEDYVSGRDPCMEAILAYEHKERMGQTLDDSAIAVLKGKFLLEPYHMATISQTPGGLHLSLTDFDSLSFQKIESDLYPISSTRFLTDVDGLEIAFPPSDNAQASELTIECGHGETRASRVPDDFLLPMQLVELGRKDELIDALLGEERDEYAAHMPDLERFLNSSGYSYLREGDRAVAIRVFKLNTELFPGSYNVWDSLGEAYMEDGQKDLAIFNYEKSLELNPHNENAKRMLRRLR